MMVRVFTKSAWIKFVVGLGISAWAVYLCFTRFDWAAIWLLISEVPGLIILFATGCYLTGFIFRAWRVSMMLEPMCKPSMMKSLSIVSIGYAGNNLLPFRMGELMRAESATKIYQIRRGTAIVQVGVERILDAMAIMILLIVGLLFVRVDGAEIPVISTLARIALIGLVAGIIGFMFLVWKGEVVRRLLIGRGRIAERIGESLISTLACLKNGKRFTGVVFASMVVWLLEAGSFSVLALYWEVNDYLFAGWFVMGVVNLSVLLPSAPGHIGVYHWAAVLALGALSVEENEAMSFSVVIHFVQWLSITAIGLLFMLLMLKRSSPNNTHSSINE